MFNLNKNEKYKKIEKNWSIYCLNTYGPWTANFGFHPDNQMKKIKLEGRSVKSYFEKGDEILPINTGNDVYFNIKEVEIYKIIIEDIN